MVYCLISMSSGRVTIQMHYNVSICNGAFPALSDYCHGCPCKCGQESSNRSLFTVEISCFDVAMSGRLGMEMQPEDMTEADKEFTQRAIQAYKGIRPIVQFGDLYRLISPLRE